MQMCVYFGSFAYLWVGVFMAGMARSKNIHKAVSAIFGKAAAICIIVTVFALPYVEFVSE